MNRGAATQRSSCERRLALLVVNVDTQLVYRIGSNARDAEARFGGKAII